MNIISKYVGKEFLKLFLLSLLSLITIFIIIDFFEKTRIFTRHHASFSLMLLYFIYKIPAISIQMTPMSVLLATILSLGILSRNNELIAMRANGVKLYNVIIPIVVISLFISIFSIIFNEYILPYTNKKALYIIDVKVEKKPQLGFFKNNKIWYHGDNFIYNIQLFDTYNNILYGVTIYYFDNKFKLIKRIDAKDAVWKNGKWRFEHIMIRKFTDNIMEERYYLERIIPLKETPETFKVIEKNTEDMSYKELKRYIKKIKKEGYDATRYLVDLYSKTSLPFVGFIMSFLGIPFALKVGKEGGIPLGIGMSIVIGFIYWAVFSFCLSLGRASVLPPILSVWFANFVFGLTALYMVLSVRY